MPSRFRLVVVLAAFALWGTLWGAPWGNGAAAFAAAAVVVQGDGPWSPIGHLEIRRDPAGRLSLSDVAFATPPLAFEAVGTFPSLGFTRDVLWARLTVLDRRAAGDPLMLELDTPFLDDVTVFVPTVADPRSVGDFAVVRLGDHHPVAERPIRHVSLVTPLAVPPGVAATLYLRVETSSTMAVRPTLHDRTSLIDRTIRLTTFFGAYYAVALVIALINLIHWIWIRDPVYLWYALYVGSLLLFTLGTNGYLPWLMPGWPPVNDVVVGTMLPLSLIFAVLFIIALLRLPTFYPRTTYLFAATAVVGVAAVPTVFTGHYVEAAPLVNLAALAATLGAIVFSVRLALRGFWPARLFMIAFSAQFFGVTITILFTIGAIPYEPWMAYSHQIGNLVHMVLMNIGLATRIKAAEEEKDAARNALLGASRDGERRATRLVEERTRELARAKDRAERALAIEQKALLEQTRFVDMLSHEYRTPLSIIRSNLDALRMDPDGGLAGRHGQRLDRMGRAIKRLVAIIEEGLDRGRLASPVRAPVRGPTDLAQILRTVVSEVRDAHPGRVLVLDGVPEGREIVLSGDPALLDVAIRNVVGNALKYSPSDLPVRIGLSWDDPDTVAVRVWDRGIGIPEADRARVFEKFFRARNAEGYPGTGIGLALVKGIVEAHHGSVDLASSPGAGTTVTMRLPIAPRAAQSL